MATYRAIAAVADAVVSLLYSHYNPADFDHSQLEFRAFQAKDFAKPMEAGVSYFLYRVYANGTYRSPAGRIGPDGKRSRTQLPVDLHFLLTAWAPDASLQHTIVSWMMRVLEDTPSLPAGLLNVKYGPVFHSDESIEVCLTELSNEELLRLWEVIVNNTFQISVPYVARNVRIESQFTLSQGEPIQTRVFDIQAPPGEFA